MSSADLEGLPPLREVIARHGLNARKGLGQHFLLDLNLTRRIARSAGVVAGASVYEVGPGPGGLTRALLEAGACVTAVERDERCVAALAELAAVSGGRLRVLAADAMAIDEAVLFETPVHVIANLPYNISTALLIKWMNRVAPFRSFTLMFQKEVAERIAAAPGTKAYGRLSVMVQWRCAVKKLFDVSPRAFTPPPKVTSTVVTLTPRERVLAEADPGILSKVVAAAFGQRRKMLRSSLKSLSSAPEALLAGAGLDPSSRAEDIDVEGFCALARQFESAGLPEAR